MGAQSPRLSSLRRVGGGRGGLVRGRSVAEGGKGALDWRAQRAEAAAKAEERRRLQEEELLRYKAEQQSGAGRDSSTTQSLADDIFPALNDLPVLPIVDEKGAINVKAATEEGVRASLLVILGPDQDEREKTDHQQQQQLIGLSEREILYIGVTRSASATLRSIVARRPREVRAFKVAHCRKPDRALLEAGRKKWLEEAGGLVSGNKDEGSLASWEKPLNVLPLLNEEEREAIAAALDDVAREKAKKNAARRVEAGLKLELKEAGVQESIRYDPMLKKRGLLDIKG